MKIVFRSLVAAACAAGTAAAVFLSPMPVGTTSSNLVAAFPVAQASFARGEVAPAGAHS